MRLSVSPAPDQKLIAILGHQTALLVQDARLEQDQPAALPGGFLFQDPLADLDGVADVDRGDEAQAVHAVESQQRLTDPAHLCAETNRRAEHEGAVGDALLIERTFEPILKVQARRISGEFGKAVEIARFDGPRGRLLDGARLEIFKKTVHWMLSNDSSPGRGGARECA